jgi:hypothetical protein
MQQAGRTHLYMTPPRWRQISLKRRRQMKKTAAAAYSAQALVVARLICCGAMLQSRPAE